jgi:hypothetical protein
MSEQDERVWANTYRDGTKRITEAEHEELHPQFSLGCPACLDRSQWRAAMRRRRLRGSE